MSRYRLRKGRHPYRHTCFATGSSAGGPPPPVLITLTHVYADPENVTAQYWFEFDDDVDEESFVEATFTHGGVAADNWDYDLGFPRRIIASNAAWEPVGLGDSVTFATTNPAFTTPTTLLSEQLPA